jgi:uncharacterized membrane protein YqjE
VSTQSNIDTGRHSAVGGGAAIGSSAPGANGAVVTAGDDVSIGKLVHDATENISTLIRGEVELAKLELKSSVSNAGTGIVFFIIAAVILVFSLTFGLIALAEGLVAAGLWRWLAYLVVFAFLVLIAALSGFIGFRKVKKVRPPKRTIETTKDTVAYLRHPTQTPTQA